MEESEKSLTIIKKKQLKVTTVLASRRIIKTITDFNESLKKVILELREQRLRKEIEKEEKKKEKRKKREGKK
jgi:hypothetical protein